MYFPNIDVIILAVGPNGLGAVRSLRDEGVRIAVICYSLTDVSMYSRLPAKKTALKSSLVEEKKLELTSILADMNCDNEVVVIPTSDFFVSTLSAMSGSLPNELKVFLPSDRVAEKLIDKAIETKLVGEVVPIPKTVQVLPDSANDLLSMLSLPIIVKPRSHKHMVLGKKNILLKSMADVEGFYSEFYAVKNMVIAQEIIEGSDENQWVCNCTFGRDGDLIQAFSFRRLRLSPSHYGVTSYAISQKNEEIISLCKKIGGFLQYRGPAMIEFKQDDRDGVYKYIEINPRLGMCNYFDTKCGVNNVYSTYLLAKGIKPNNGLRMKSGTIFLSAYEDFFSRTHDGEGVHRIIRDYLSNMLKPHVFIYFTMYDPKPALVLGWRQFVEVLRSLLARV